MKTILIVISPAYASCPVRSDRQTTGSRQLDGWRCVHGKRVNPKGTAPKKSVGAAPPNAASRRAARIVKKKINFTVYDSSGYTGSRAVKWKLAKVYLSQRRVF